MNDINYNPDVLSCIANLSNDEVFTSPALANQMLDLLPPELWSNKDVTFLDPFTKSGVFLREAAKRLVAGLELQIPDRQERINHIFSKQLYGIAITELTSLLARRSVYCSKTANGKYSVCDTFTNEQGNILYSRVQHTWVNGKCKYCGASQAIYDRDKELETHAYQFIHICNLDEIFKDMRFDVIIGNPPYQLGDGSGGSSDSAMPIYNKFVEQAIKLTPKYLSMIIPSKWMVGGRGLQSFRDSMFENRHLKLMFDFEDAGECFTGIHIDGGVCYFLIDNSYNGKVNYIFKSQSGVLTNTWQYLKNDYFDFVIRDQRILSILDKIGKCDKFSNIVSSRKPFGIETDLFNNSKQYTNANLKSEPYSNSIKVYGVKGIKGGAKRIIGYINSQFVSDSKDSITKYKLYFSKTYSTNAINPPEIILGLPNTVCTSTFLMIGTFDSEKEQKYCYDYMHTNFFKMLLYFGKGTMNVTKTVFSLIPLQDFTQPWTDEKLYAKYGLTTEEIAFIESMIRPME